MLVIDPWLLDLGVQSPEAAHIAAFIGRAQFRASRRLHHIMNIGGEAERSRIASAARLGKMSHEPVYCMRCGAGAMLSAWVQDDVLTEGGEYPPDITTLNPRQHMAVAFRLPCEGTRVSMALGAHLKRWLDAQGVRP